MKNIYNLIDKFNVFSLDISIENKANEIKIEKNNLKPNNKFTSAFGGYKVSMMDVADNTANIDVMNNELNSLKQQKHDLAFKNICQNSKVPQLSQWTFTAIKTWCTSNLKDQKDINTVLKQWNIEHNTIKKIAKSDVTEEVIRGAAYEFLPEFIGELEDTKDGKMEITGEESPYNNDLDFAE